MPYLQLYGMTGVSSVMPLPIEANRAPGINDTNAVPGQEWIDQTDGTVYFFGGTVGGDAIWTGAGSAGVFNAIDVTNGPNTIDGTTAINNSHDSNTNINTGTSTGDVSIGNVGNGGPVTITSSIAIVIASPGPVAIDSNGDTIDIGENFLSDINIGTVAGAKVITVGNADGLTNTVFKTFHATANAATSANASFTANAGMVKCTISNLNTASAASGTITVTNTVIGVGSAVLVNFALAGAEDATMTIKKIRITANTATITYTNNGAAAIASDAYMSLVVLN